MIRFFASLMIFLLSFGLLAQPALSQPVPGWPAQVERVLYLSAADNSQQSALYYDPPVASPKPLLVALHSWSGDYTQANPAYADWCIAEGWVLVHPNFRGINDHPEACGSELAVKDIVSAVEYAKSRSTINPNRIYLMGASGGGYASLLMAGRHPEIWAAVSAWCPIYDLKLWHAETRERKLKYADMLEQVCGGPPGKSSVVDTQYQQRSASQWLSNAKQVTLAIQTGITDGHNGSVPVGHTLRAFNAVADRQHAVSEAIIERMQAAPMMPADLLQTIDDPHFARQPALFRKRSGSCQVTIFQGGHDIIYDAGLAWLEQQRKGQPAVW